MISLAEAAGRVRERLASRREQLQSERDSYLGDCWYCKDSGSMWEGQSCSHCERGAAIRGQRQAGERATNRLAIIEAMRLPPRVAGFDFATYPAVNDGLRKEVLEVLEQWDGHRSLLLWGAYGVGKTSLMVAALKMVAAVYAEEERSPGCIAFVSAPTLFRELRAGYKNDAKEDTYDAVLARYQRVRLLALDDLGAEKPSEWVAEQMYLLINDRYDQQRPLFITSNLSLPQLESRIGERVTWRLTEMCEQIELSGQNLRERP